RSRGHASWSLCPPAWDLLLCAKDLFVGAIRQRSRGFRTSQSPQVQNFDLSQRFWCPGLGFNEQSFGANEQVPEQGQSDKEPYCAARPRHQHEETNTI